MSTSDAVRLISEHMDDHFHRLLWDAISLSCALGNVRGAYPRSDGYLYRKTLQALKVMHDHGVIGMYTTTMNENVYYETYRISTTKRPF